MERFSTNVFLITDLGLASLGLFRRLRPRSLTKKTSAIYGWLANCHRAQRLATCRHLLGVEPPAAESPANGEDYRDRYQRLTGRSLRDCPVCGKGHMVRIEGGVPGILPRAPPAPAHVH